MTSKTLTFILIIVSLLVLLAVFTLAGTAQSNNRVFLPSVHSVAGGGDPDTPTPTPEPEPRHFDDCAFATGENATIGVKKDVVINGTLVLDADDEVAVFTPDGSICAGVELWSGNNIAITAWGDNSITNEIDGLRNGEEMIFRIWDESENKEIAVEKIDYSLGNGIYVIDGIYVVASFTLE